MDIESQLPKNEERFLSKYVAMLITLGYLTVEKLYEIFTPFELFKCYENEMDRRRAIFALTKLGSAYAEEFDLAGSANILTKGVKLGDVKLSDLYTVVSPDELVRVHDRKTLYKLTKDAKPFVTKDEKSLRLMAHAINDTIKERLGSDNPSDIEKDREDGKASKVYQFVVDAIGEPMFTSDYVPAEARGRILKAGLDAYKEGHMFTPDIIFHAVPLAELVGYLPFEKLEPVIDAVALRFEWVDPPHKYFAVPKPSMDLLPAGALDSIPPPPEDPEIVETQTADPSDADADDGDEESPVMVSSVQSVPPPLPRRRR